MAASGSAVARRYAKALIGLAQEEGRVEAVREEFGALIDLIESNPILGQVLARPLFPAAQRRAVLTRVAERMHLGELVRHFCAFLIDQRRMLELTAIREAYDRLADAAAGRVPGEVTAARPLDSESLEKLRQALEKQTGRDVELAVHVEPELIGGVIARIGDLVFDGSLRTQLAQVRASLTKE